MTNPLAPQLLQGQNGTQHINAALADLATLNAYTVAQLAALSPIASYVGNIVFCSNGAAGQPCLAYCNGTAWERVLLGAAVSTTS